MRLATKTLERGDRKENKIDEVRPNLIFVFILFSHLILKLATEKVIRGHSTLHAGIVLGLQTRVLVLGPPKLACRAVFGSYPRG